MPHIDSNRRKPARRIPAAAVLLILLLACLGLAACGGSSSSSSTSASASATTSSTGAAGTGATGAGASRFKALRECLQKNGITLPKPTPGQRSPGGPGGAGGFLGGGGGAGGPKLPSGVTRAQYEAAIKKCGGGGHFLRSGPAGFSNPAFKQALTKFAACMRENGINVPAPNTSGSGPVFDTKGIDTASSQFRTAESKCRSDLTGAFRRGAGAGAAGGAPRATPGGAPAG